MATKLDISRMASATRDEGMLAAIRQPANDQHDSDARQARIDRLNRRTAIACCVLAALTVVYFAAQIVRGAL